MKTARQPLDHGLAEPPIVSSYCVEQAYEELNKKENKHINLLITRNRKQETNKPPLKAMGIFAHNTTGN